MALFFVTLAAAAARLEMQCIGRGSGCVLVPRLQAYRNGANLLQNDLAYDLVKQWVQFLDDVGDVVAPASAFISKFIPKLTLPPAANKTLYKAIYQIIMFSDELDQAISDITKLVTGKNSDPALYGAYSNVVTNDIGYDLVKKWVQFLDDVGDFVQPVTKFVSKFIPELTLPSAVNKTLYKAIYRIIMFSDELDQAISDIKKLVTGKNAAEKGLAWELADKWVHFLDYLAGKNALQNGLAYDLADKWVHFLDYLAGKNAVEKGLAWELADKWVHFLDYLAGKNDMQNDLVYDLLLKWGKLVDSVVSKNGMQNDLAYDLAVKWVKFLDYLAGKNAPYDFAARPPISPLMRQ